MEAFHMPEPRGNRRLIYVSDPSSIASRYLPDPVTEQDLRDWVDDLAAAEVDTFIQEVYTQAWTVYWRADGFEYDARPQHRRFLPLLDAGIQPLDVLIDQSHRRNMEFMAGFRINDNHGHISVKQGVGAGGSFILSHPEWRLQDNPPGDFYRLSTPLDFSFSEVRDYLLAVMTEVARRFDVNGLEMCFRDHSYFPHDTGRERQPLMTGLVRRVRAMLDQEGQRKGKRLLLGVRVNQTLEECQDRGLDVPTWIQERLVNYVSPADTMYTDFNAPYSDFARLARAADGYLYPALLPWSSFRRRKRLNQDPLTRDNLRAAALQFYGAGADGISVYNHFEMLLPGSGHPPFYPLALQELGDLKDPEQVRQGGPRHYLFEPVWGGATGFGEDRASTGAVKADKIVLSRAAPQASGEYLFRLYEDLGRVRGAVLLFRCFNMTLADTIEVQLNQTPIPAGALKRRNDEARTNTHTLVDRNSYLAVAERFGPEKHARNLQPTPEPPFVTCWFALTMPPAVFGENRLNVRLLTGDPQAQADIVIDEIEVFVIP
ncbi:MAG: family 10 glycosylhydrolase [Chloroflexi bacterium]|nr:family 10 glycosylhydrolase [Chloroflexota bacterium]